MIRDNEEGVTPCLSARKFRQEVFDEIYFADFGVNFERK